MVIDFHTHAFPGALAARAVEALSFASGGLIPQTDGSLGSLKAEMARDGVDISVVHCIATKPAQQTNVNNFAIAAMDDPAIIPFGSVHPEAPDAFEELERLAAAGIRGIKLHPEYQRFYVNDPRLKPLYRQISRLGFVTLFHAGRDYGMLPPYHCMPEQLAQALSWFDSPVVAAHWGGVGCGEAVLEKLCGENVWFDLSFGYGSMAKCVAQRILDSHTPDRLLFGSDMPWHRPAWELRLLDTLDLSPADREKILSGNAIKLLGLGAQ